MMKRHLLALLFAAAALPLRAGDFDVRVGHYDAMQHSAVAFQWNLHLTEGLRFAPNVEYIPSDQATVASLNADVLYDFIPRGRVTPFAGVGVGVLHVGVFGLNAEQAAENAIGGVQWRSGEVRPYVAVKYFRLMNGGEGHDTQFAIGVRF